MSFLVGGGGDINTERVELVVDDAVARKATGKYTETMERVTWDVSDLRGKTARIRLVDEAGGGWGHINFDDLQVEVAPPAPATLRPEKDAYGAGEAIVVVVANAPGNSGDWITLVPADTPPTQYREWKYLLSQRDTKITFAGVPAGTYEACLYYNHPAGGYNVRARCTVTVR